MMPTKTRVIVIGMADSIHVARWLDVAIDSRDIAVRFVPTSPHRRIQKGIATRLASGTDGSFTMNPFLKWASLPIWILDRDPMLRGRLRASFIRQEINRFRPDFIHVMETQNGGYPFAIAADKLRAEGFRLPKAMLTLFGSDLYWFARFPNHLERIKRVLTNVQILSAECARDLRHAKEIGFSGSTLPLMPVSGGLADNEIAHPDTPIDFAHRKTIAIKGYGGIWGQGHLAVEALAGIPELLQGYTVEIYSAEQPVVKAAARLLKPAGINYLLYKKFALSHDQILQLYRRSRIYLGLSKSDGLPASMLEAMSQGCFPIQSSSACSESWIEPGVTASVIGSLEGNELEVALREALDNDQLLLAAQAGNLKTIRDKYSKTALLSSKKIGYAELANS